MVLLAPGMGDAIQAAKAGILEVGDVYVVNKADRDGADATVRELRHMLTLGERRQPGDWRPPIVKTVASRGEGIDELRRGARQAPRLARGDRRSCTSAACTGRRDEVETIALTALRERMGDLRASDGENGLDALAARRRRRTHRSLRRGRPAAGGSDRRLTPGKAVSAGRRRSRSRSASAWWRTARWSRSRTASAAGWATRGGLGGGGDARAGEGHVLVHDPRQR